MSCPFCKLEAVCPLVCPLCAIEIHEKTIRALVVHIKFDHKLKDCPCWKTSELTRSLMDVVDAWQLHIADLLVKGENVKTHLEFYALGKRVRE